MTSEFGRQQTSIDTASGAKYGRRNPVQLSNLLHSRDSQSLAIAEWLASSRAEPSVQVRDGTFRVEDDQSGTAVWASEVDEGWMVDIDDSLTGASDISAHVIGLHHEWTWTSWTVTLRLDTTRTDFDAFVWGTSLWDGVDGWTF